MKHLLVSMAAEEKWGWIYFLNSLMLENKEKFMGIKPGPKRTAISTGKPDKRQRDNKETPKNTPSLKPHKHKKSD